MKQALMTTAALLGGCTSSVASQQLERRPVPTRGIVSFIYQSPTMNERYGVNVGLPVGFVPGGLKKYPALITTDGDQVFMGVYEAARTLIEENTIEPIFVVSIGAELDRGDSVWARRQIYEFSPPEGPARRLWAADRPGVR